jgi:dipeptidyl aminopeptidase/acylaminoacyl peptidase
MGVLMRRNRLGRAGRGGQVLLLLALFLAACGGGDEPAPPAGDTPDAGEQGGFELLSQSLEDGIQQAYLAYPSGDLKVTGWLFVNPYSEEDIEPCVIFNHGGVDGVTESTRALCRRLAKEGYIVFAPSYRGEDDSEGRVEVARGEVDDVLAALLLLRDHPGIRPGRFALVGTSHGALVSVLAATRPPAHELVRGVVAAYGVMDIHRWYPYLVAHGFDVSDSLTVAVYGQGPEDRPEAFAARSAVARAGQVGPMPVLLVQGGKDEVVPPEQAEAMLDALRGAGRTDDRLLLVEEGGHGFLFWDDPALHGPAELEAADRAWREILAFLDACLADDASG